MGIFNWVQDKFTGKQQEKSKVQLGSDSTRRPSSTTDQKEEFSDWPQALLAIGTFGNHDIKAAETRHDDPGESSHSSQDFPDFTIEELSKLRKELRRLLTHKRKQSIDGSGEGPNLPLNRFLNCPSTLEVDRRASTKLCADQHNNGNGGDLSPASKIILSKVKDILTDKRNAIKRKSVTFLLKKMFACRGGFSPAPSLRDPIPESKMEKLLRIALHKKIYPRNSAASSSNNKYIERKPLEKNRIEDKEKLDERGEDIGTWVKTDSEFIVLEMK